MSFKNEEVGDESQRKKGGDEKHSDFEFA